MKIQGVNITGGIRLDPPAAPTPSGPSKFVTGAVRTNNFAGRAYICNSDGTSEVILYKPPAVTSEFGTSVAIASTKVAVGASRADSNTGYAYIYNTDGTGEVKITASDAATNDRFGLPVASVA